MAETNDPQDTFVAEGCVHHWIIEAAWANNQRSESSRGECQKCGEARMFTNSIQYDMYRGLDNKPSETLQEEAKGRRSEKSYRP